MVSPEIEIKADVTKPIEQITDTTVGAANFIGKVLGAPIEVAGAIVSDQLKHWRAANLERLHAKWLKKLNDRGISPDAANKLSFDIGVPLLEAAAMEQNEDVQELWAGLLASGTTPDGNQTIKRIHIEILRAISTIEARVLKYLYLTSIGYIDRDSYNQLATYPEDEMRVALLNLRRQECIRPKLNDRLLWDVNNIDDILATGKGVEKEGLKEAFHALRKLVEDLSGANDNLRLRFGATDFALTELANDLMKLCVVPAK